MIRLAISVEGQTEEEFVKTVLQPHFLERDIDARPKIVVTKKVLSGSNHKGGDLSLPRVEREVRPLLSGFDYVTTLYDLYGFRDRLPNEDAKALAARIQALLGDPRTFLPYIQSYEFETLLLTQPETVAHFLDAPAVATAIKTTVERAGGAEAVNDNPATCPSARLSKWFQCHNPEEKFVKTLHGPLLAEAIGLPAMRAACPGFDAWINRLENLAVAP